MTSFMRSTQVFFNSPKHDPRNRLQPPRAWVRRQQKRELFTHPVSDDRAPSSTTCLLPWQRPDGRSQSRSWTD